MGKFIV